MIDLKKIAALAAQRRQLNKETLSKVASLIAQKRQQSLTKEAGMEKQGNWLKNLLSFKAKPSLATAKTNLRDAKKALNDLQQLNANAAKGQTTFIRGNISASPSVSNRQIGYAKGRVTLAELNLRKVIQERAAIRRSNIAKGLGLSAATFSGAGGLGYGISSLFGWSDPNDDPTFYAQLNSNSRSNIQPTEAPKPGATNTSDESGVISWIKNNPWLAGILALSAGGLLGAGIYAATSKNDLDLLELEDQNSYKYKYGRR